MILFMAAVLQMLTQVYPMDPGTLLLINLEFHSDLSSRNGHSNDFVHGSSATDVDTGVPNGPR